MGQKTIQKPIKNKHTCLTVAVLYMARRGFCLVSEAAKNPV